jgi:hypothetical protein
MCKSTGKTFNDSRLGLNRTEDFAKAVKYDPLFRLAPREVEAFPDRYERVTMPCVLGSSSQWRVAQDAIAH